LNISIIDSRSSFDIRLIEYSISLFPCAKRGADRRRVPRKQAQLDWVVCGVLIVMAFLQMKDDNEGSQQHYTFTQRRPTD